MFMKLILDIPLLSLYTDKSRKTIAAVKTTYTLLGELMLRLADVS